MFTGCFVYQIQLKLPSFRYALTLLELPLFNVNFVCITLIDLHNLKISARQNILISFLTNIIS
jgi:hypothetical protein